MESIFIIFMILVILSSIYYFTVQQEYFSNKNLKNRMNN